MKTQPDPGQDRNHEQPAGMIDLAGLQFLPFERLRVARPVERIDHIVAQCRGRRVLDVGCFDEQQVDRPQAAGWRWLHAEIAATAAETLGVDDSEKLPPEGISTRVGTRIVRASVDNLGPIASEFQPDLVVAGELIEHTPNTHAWIRALGQAIPGTRFLATTPNATSLLNVALAPLGRESSSFDHLQIYSYKTLCMLSLRLGMRNVRITPYYVHADLLRGRVSPLLGGLIGLIDATALRWTQYLVPLWAGGLIWEAELSDGTDLGPALPPRDLAGLVSDSIG